MAWENENTLAELYARKRAALKAGKDLIDLSMVNPDLAPPRELQDRLIEAISKQGSHKYSSSRGVRKLREAFTERYQTFFDVSLDFDSQCCVTLGAKDAVLHALAWFRQYSKVVLVGEPMYPAYRFAARYLGMEIKGFRLDQPVAAMLEDLNQLAALYPGATLLLNLPGNPVCNRVDGAFYDSVADVVEAHNLNVINDFVYGEMLFDEQPAVSMLECQRLKARGVECYSLSKAFSVPGWRIGALLGASQVIEGVAGLKSRVDFGTFLPLQFAAASALQQGRGPVIQMVEIYRRRFKLMETMLSDLGWEICPAEGGCCLWAKHAHDGLPGDVLAHEMLAQGLAVLPGKAFGTQFDSFLRFALVVDDASLREAARRVGLAQRNLSDTSNKETAA